MSSEKWYKKTWGIILCLILFFPVGLYLMCRYAEWNKGVKIAVIGFFLVLLLFSSVDDKNTAPSDGQQGNDTIVISTETTTESTTEETTAKKLTTIQITTTETTAEGITEDETESDYLAEDAESEKSEMVWIPNSGKKYHSYEGCSNMKDPSYVTMDEAESSGYTACSRCW